MIFSLFSGRAKENEIKEVVDDISFLARHYPNRFFVRDLDRYKSTYSEDEHFSILHDLFSIHLERRGIFESEFDFINRNENVKNKIDLEVRRIYDHIKAKELLLPESRYNTKDDIKSTILLLCKKYMKSPKSFFLSLGWLKFGSANSYDEKVEIIHNEFISILGYYGISFNNEVFNDVELKNTYTQCLKKLIPKIIKNY